MFAYSRPYAAFDEAVLVRADSPITLAGRPARRARGGDRRLDQHAAGRDVRRRRAGRASTARSDDVFAEMIDGGRATAHIDAFVDDEPAFGGAVAGGEFRVAHVAETQNAWGAACRKGDEATVAA